MLYKKYRFQRISSLLSDIDSLASELEMMERDKNEIYIEYLYKRKILDKMFKELTGYKKEYNINDEERKRRSDNLLKNKFKRNI